MLLVPRSLLRSLEGHIRRHHLTQRTRTIINQDRAEALAYATGWRPPRGVQRTGVPRHE